MRKPLKLQIELRVAFTMSTEVDREKMDVVTTYNTFSRWLSNRILNNNMEEMRRTVELFKAFQDMSYCNSKGELWSKYFSKYKSKCFLKILHSNI